MLTLAFVAAALATPSPPIPSIHVVDAECRPTEVIGAGDRLEAYHIVSWQSCPPGGPCAHIGSEDQGMQEVVLRQGDEVEEGRWHRTARTCGEAEVWRWSGELEPGIHTLIRGQGFGQTQIYVHPDAPLGEPRVEEQHGEQLVYVTAEEAHHLLEHGYVPGYGPMIGGGGERMEARKSWTRRSTWTEVGDGLSCIVEHETTNVVSIASLDQERTFPQPLLRQGQPGPCPPTAEGSDR